MPEVRLQPRRNPDPTFPFRNRDFEKEIVRSKLIRLAQGEPGALPVLCFWGAAGIGKSWLLGELERLYRRHAPPSSDWREKPTIAARLDLDQTLPSSLWHEKQMDRGRLIHELWCQLAEQAGAAVPALKEMPLEAQADALVRQITAWLEYFTPVLLFDTVDDLVRDDEESFFWLEEHLIERLALTDRVLLVFAGRGELRRWRRFQVRRRVDLLPLVSFDPEEAGAAVGAGPQVSRVLFRHAFGHPLATRYLAELLLERGVDLQVASAEEIDRLLTPPLVQVVLRQTIDHILAKAPEAILWLARTVAVLRWINVEPLRHLANEVGKGVFGRDPYGQSDAYYLELIGQLQSSHLVYWDIGKGVFVLPWALRSLLAYEQKINMPQLFQKAHLAAYNFHYGHIRAFPAYLTHYVPEAAYHWGVLRQAGLLPSNVQDFSIWWRDFVARGGLRDSALLVELEETLKTDTELQEIWPEGIEVILSLPKTAVHLPGASEVPGR
ncbi:MAG: hypothetical protein N2204_07065 [Anaerolineae bacterium]|nr:hypothetical protein [Anaerolineae bacterium]